MNDIDENWKDIDGYEGRYQVSNLGRIKSLNYIKSKKTKIIKCNRDNDGYYSVVLYKNVKPKRYKIHRLVALMFIENPYNKPQVNHIDACKWNNNVNNLEWCTAKENLRHAWNMGLMEKSRDAFRKYGGKNATLILSKSVMQFTKDGIFVAEYSSMAEARKQTRILQSCISACCRKKHKTAGGYIWKFK
jgi:hypothetical protein